MASFKVEGLDSKGLPMHEDVEADSAYSAVERLRGDGKYVYSIKSAGGSIGGARALRADEMSLLSEQLASLTESGMPLAPALGELSREIDSPKLKAILAQAKKDIEQGRSVEEAFSRDAGAFPPAYMCLLRAGERTGNLPGVLRQLTDYANRVVRLNYRVQAVLAYPVILLLFLCVFMGLLATAIVPQFEQMFQMFRGHLPLPTRIVLGIGHAVQVLGVPALIAAGIVTVCMAVLGNVSPFGSAAGRLADTLRLHSPFIGPMYRAVITGRFFRTLGMLLGNGVPIVESMQLAGMASGSPRFAGAAIAAAGKVANGNPVGDSLESTGLLKHSLCWMLKQGETNGTLVNTLARLADACDGQAERNESSLIAMLGPGLIVVTGIVVGFAVVSLFMPILMLSSMVSS